MEGAVIEVDLCGDGSGLILCGAEGMERDT